MKLLSQLKLAQKLGLVMFVVMVPIVYLTYQHVSRLQTAMANDQLALDGMRYVEGLQDALVPVARHEAFAVAAILGDAESAGKAAQVAAEVEAGFAKFEKAHVEFAKGGEVDRLWGQAPVRRWIATSASA
ncbi:MAG: hypothetical protein O9284_15980 [Steroidobacteraceae bacterium]|jgi:hypothetical protein|nr:hypothetical protein [Steroidobacteraceae bacterium]